jgi:rhodanese-related sulfurtransferase
MIKIVDSDELKAKFDSDKKFILLDVREPNEFEAGHIPDAILVPLSSFPENYSKFVNDPNEEIILTCRSGSRSMKVAQFLESNGFKNLANHEGGILDWTACGYPISKS